MKMWLVSYTSRKCPEGTIALWGDHPAAIVARLSVTSDPILRIFSAIPVAEDTLTEEQIEVLSS